MKRSLLILIKVVFLLIKSVSAQIDDFPQKTESPYFLIKGENSHVENFPLLSTSVQVEVAGPIANVVVEQTYRNNGKIPIEATYVFPASTRAAVYDLEMIIGDRRVKAEIQEKEKARKNYENAKAEGKRVSLLEQHRPNVFQMNLANIMPGDLIHVILRYNEFIIPENQQSQFIYPTVVGPRFVSDKNRGTNESFAANPYLQEGEENPAKFDIQVQLSMPVPVVSASSPSHQIDVTFLDSYKASARLSSTEKSGGNRDFIFAFSASGEKVASGTVLYEHEDEKFFLTTIEPSQLKSAEQVLPREYIFVIDVSGSMFGFPIETTKKLMKDLVHKLGPEDLFNVLLFAGGNTMLASNSIPANETNLAKACEVIDQLQGSGTTEIIPALKRIFSVPKKSGLSRSIVIVTDGYVSVEPEVFELIGRHADQGNVFAFGIGSGVNRYLIEGIAHAGRGESFVVTRPEMAYEIVNQFRNYIESPLMTDIQFNFSDFDAYDVIPSVVPDLMAERPLYIFGKYRGEAKGEVTLSGIQAGQNYRQVLPIKQNAVDKRNSAIRYLWAREMIRWNQDFMKLMADEKRKEEITRLGLKYNLMTDYTSFIAVDEVQVVNAGGMLTRVKQPLPLPQHVSNYAVGFDMALDGVVEANKVNPDVKLKPVLTKENHQWEKKFVHDLELAMSSWDAAWLTKWANKNLIIIISDPISDTEMSIDGVALNHKERRALLFLLIRLKNDVRSGEKMELKLCSK